jgi:hypothetical protein
MLPGKQANREMKYAWLKLGKDTLLNMNVGTGP